MPGGSRKTSFLWKYFTQTVPDEATCNICSGVLSIKNGCNGNLNRHLRTKHRDLVISKQPLDCIEENSQEAIKMETPGSGGRKRSYIWRYFKPAPAKKVRCLLCETYLSMQTTGNMSRHLALKHADAQISKEPFTQVERDNEVADVVWRYFEVTDEDECEARCAVCLQEVSHRDGVGDMRRHLEAEHPDLAAAAEKKKLVLLSTPSGDLEISCEDLSFDQVYVEEGPRPAAPEKSKVRPRKKRKVRPKTPDTTDSEDNRPVLQKKETARHKETARQRERPDEDASIDNFGRYITSLIKKLPKHIACKIQMDFVTQIMQAQLEWEKSEAAAPAGLEEIPAPVNGEQNGEAEGS